VSVNGGSVGNFTNKSQILQAIEIFYNSRSPYGESPIHLFCGPTITDSPNSTDSLLSPTVPVALGVISTVIYREKRLETEGYLTG
jgi:hypothetical protein